MNAIAERLAPSAAEMIRTDHRKVLSAFHRYKIASSPGKKTALANKICLALEVHAQLEEEIFYPAVRAVHPALVEKSVPEHDEMRALIEVLRAMEDHDGEGFDRTFMELMRIVIHHVADEETMLLPDAERALGEELGSIGARMMARRLQLMAPRAAEIARNTARALPATPLLVAAGALVAGAWFFRRRAL